MKDVLLRLKHTAKLERMIEEDYSYEEILKQSQKLDKYITSEMEKLNNLNKTS